MIIDAHNHPDWHGHSLDRFLANMKKYNIDKTWLLSWEAPADECDPNMNYCMPPAGAGGPIPFQQCVSYSERSPGKFILGYAPDPRRPEAIDRLHAAIEIYNVRICGELKLRMMYDNPDALRLFSFCGEKGLPVVVHIDYEFDTGQKYPRPNYWYGGGIEAFERAVAACPDTVFLGHGPGFWAHISADGQYNQVPYPHGRVVPGGKIIDMLHRYPNLYCDLSAGSGLNALSRDPQFASDFLVQFQERLLYARDCFDNKLQAFLTDLQVPGEVMDKILSVNATKLIEGGR